MLARATRRPVLSFFTLLLCASACGDDVSGGPSMAPPEAPLLVAPPALTYAAELDLFGEAEAGVDVVAVSPAATVRAAATTEGVFQLTLPLVVGPNPIELFAENRGGRSEPVSFEVTRAEPTMTIASVMPTSVVAGGILTLSGTGFNPDRNELQAYFNGSAIAMHAAVVSASATSVEVVVPFVFMAGDSSVELSLYDSATVSNVVSIEVPTATDPTPGVAGNESLLFFDHFQAVSRAVRTHGDTWLRPHVAADEWQGVADNFDAIETFFAELHHKLANEFDAERLAEMDAAFGSEIFARINALQAGIAPLTSRDTASSDMICDFQDVLDDLILIRDLLQANCYALIAAEVGCAFVPYCWPYMGLCEALREVFCEIYNIADTLVSFLQGAVPRFPSNWGFEVDGPYNGTANDVFFTNADHQMRVYVDLENGSVTQGWFGDFAGSILNTILYLFDVEIPSVAIEGVEVTTTIEISDISIVDSYGSYSSATHTLRGLRPGPVDIRIQSNCPHWDYDESFLFESLDGPRIDEVRWQVMTPGVYEFWKVSGKGFSSDCSVMDIFVDDSPGMSNCTCAYANDDVVDHTELHLKRDCYGGDPFRLRLGLNEERVNELVKLPPPGGTDLTIDEVKPASVYPGQILWLEAAPLPYNRQQAMEDLVAKFSGTGSLLIEPAIDHERTGVYEALAFRVPSALAALGATTIPIHLTLEVSDLVIGGGASQADAMLTLKAVESAADGAHDLTVYGAPFGVARAVSTGDLDGDGELDLVVGVPEYRIDYFGEQRAIGAVYIMFGPVFGGSGVIDWTTVGAVGEPSGHWDVVIFGDFNQIDAGGNSRRIGQALAVGDVDGDGRDDLLIGSTDQDDADQHLYNVNLDPITPTHVPGRALLFYGRDRDAWKAEAGIFRTSLNAQDVVIAGDATREVGRQVAVADLNGDFHADLVVTAPSDPVTAAVTNQVTANAYVLFGGARLPASIDLDTALQGQGNGGFAIRAQDVAQQATVIGSYYGDGMGKSIATGDLDGNGIADLFLGAPQYSRLDLTGEHKGAGYLFFGNAALGADRVAGPNGDQDFLLEGQVMGAAAIGDLSGDGIGELAVELPLTLNDQWDYGRIAILGGHWLTSHWVGSDRLHMVDDFYDDMLMKSACNVYGSSSISRLGASLAIADLDGDGFGDLIAGAPGADLGTPLAANVWVLYGEADPDWLATTYFTLYHNWISLIAHVATTESMNGTYRDALFSGELLAPGFGSAVAVGDFSPYEGADLLVVDPSAPGPAGRQNAGVLYGFYGATDTVRSLALHPAVSARPLCDSRQVLTASGGEPPYTFEAVAALPPEAEVVTQETNALGTVTDFGDDAALLKLTGCVADGTGIDIRVTDGASNTATASVQYGGGTPLALTPANAVLDICYGTELFAASGGLPPYTFTLEAVDILVPAVTLDDHGDGTATLGLEVGSCVAEQYRVRVRVEDGGGASLTAEVLFALGFPLPLVVLPSTATLDPCSGSELFVASGGTWPFAFDLVGVPATGIELTDHGDGSATVDLSQCVADGETIALRLSDGAAATAFADLTFTTSSGDLTITPDTVTLPLCDASQSFGANGGTPPYMFGFGGAGDPLLDLVDNGDGTADLTATGCLSDPTTVNVQVMDAMENLATATVTYQSGG